MNVTEKYCDHFTQLKYGASISILPVYKKAQFNPAEVVSKNASREPGLPSPLADDEALPLGYRSRSCGELDSTPTQQ